MRNVTTATKYSSLPARKMTSYSTSALEQRPSRSVVLSDVDGTIVRGSLVLQHATALHNSELIDLGSLPSQWADDKKNEDLITALAIAYQKAITGMHISELGIEPFIDSICSNSESFYSALNRLVTLKNAGAEVWLVSGSPDFLVGSLANRYGFKTAASRYHKSDSGHFTGVIQGMFSAPAKREFVSTLDLAGYNEIHAFGDTTSDVPLFEASSYSVLVAPNQHTRDTIGATVNEIVEH